ncbi:hypothetical protein TNCV_1173301 [Trichonephila clavipes]|uniref:Uncharacterized protein n=1 Tax=Trichonephila clavipes TaxID=2585209 RepID=A0A8X6S5Q2_TRICX|nr:hypothetical protein TNCV_1173301 [Trichonephila clavipes]
MQWLLHLETCRVCKGLVAKNDAAPLEKKIRGYSCFFYDTHIKTARGLLATDHVILNHGQVTWTTPELALPSPNYHTTPVYERRTLKQHEGYGRWIS